MYRPLTTDANDASGNGRNGTASNVTFADGYANVSSGGYIRFPAFTVPASFTLSMRAQIGGTE